MVLAKNAVKARILEYFRFVEATGEDIIVTDHGKPRIRISAVKSAGSVEEVFSAYRGKTAITGDTISPTTEEWGEL